MGFFLTYTTGQPHSEKSSCKITPKFSSRSNSSSICSNTPKAHFFFFCLKIGFAFSFTSNFASVFLQIPRPSENTCGNFIFRSFIIFSVTWFLKTEETLIWLQKEFIGSFYKLKSTVTRLEIFIPRREFIFRSWEDGTVGHLIQRKISSS